MYEFAKVAEDRSIRVPKMKVVVSNAEPLFEYQRQVIGKAFQAPVIDTYGSAEMVVAAGECGQGGLHLWPDAGLLEIASDELNNPVEEGQPGKLICTGLLNDDMPLIRFDIGDRGTMCPPGPVCCCGRSLPMLRGIDGRADDVVLTPDGRRVGRLDPAFKAGFPIRCAQVIQETEDRIRVLVEPAHGYSARTADEIVGALSRMLGAMEIAVEETERIPRGPNGKLRGVINRLLVESE
jgi:phenylacetate-CoA ligase